VSGRIRIGLYSMPPVTHHSVATWKLQRNAARGLRFDRLGLWKETARLAERAGFDFVFAADTNGIYSEYGGSHEAAVRYALQVPCFDAAVLMTAIGAVTNHLGVIATHSIVGTEPYLVARKFATLDHLTGGRAGWNVVTGTHRNAAENLGLQELIDHDERYEMADEFVDVCRALWNSWDQDAIVLDVDGDRFADPARVHPIDHVGKYYRSAGPLNIHRSPQVGPLLVQAGSSARGRRAAGRFAEAIFSIQPTREGMKAYRDDIRRIAADEFGRDPDSIKVLHSVQPFVGETEAIAREKLELHNRLVSSEAGVAMLSGHVGVDLGSRDLDLPASELSDAPGARGIAQVYANGRGAGEITLGELGRGYGRNVLSPQLVGTGEQIADWLVETFEEVGGDGFMISPVTLPAALEDFVDLVVPELRRRGRVREEYAAGATLRELLLAE
jgi:long-chain alkane monooxygenase